MDKLSLIVKVPTAVAGLILYAVCWTAGYAAECLWAMARDGAKKGWKDGV